MAHRSKSTAVYLDGEAIDPGGTTPFPISPSIRLRRLRRTLCGTVGEAACICAAVSRDSGKWIWTTSSCAHTILFDQEMEFTNVGEVQARRQFILSDHPLAVNFRLPIQYLQAGKKSISHMETEHDISCVTLLHSGCICTSSHTRLPRWKTIRPT